MPTPKAATSTMLVASTATTNTNPLTGDDCAASIAPSPGRRTILMLAPFQARTGGSCALDGAPHRPRGPVVHQQADVRALRGDPGYLLRVGDVQGDRQDARFGDRGGIAGGAVDLGRAAADQFPGEGQAQSPVGPGDQGDRSADLHSRIIPLAPSVISGS